MRKVFIVLLSAVVAISFAFLCACGAAPSEEKDETQLMTISGVTFNGATYDYDGTEKVITVTGNIPAGVTVTYSGNKGTDVGEYSATATLSGEGYEQLVLTAKLVIGKIEMSGLSFNGDTVEYDANEHSVYLEGSYPIGATVTYTYDGIERTGVTEVGSYTVCVTVKHKNYIDYSATVTLKITATEKYLSSVYSNGAVYFQNDLDGESLYKVNGSTLSKVNTDVATNMVAYGNSVFYLNEGKIFSSVRSLDTTSGELSSIVYAGAKSLAFDGTYLYYSINNIILLTSENGIYKIKADGTEEEGVRLTTDKADYLTYYNGYIYYSNLSDDGKLYRISVNVTEQKGECLDEEKVSYIIEDAGVLYYNSSKLLGAAVSKYTISTGKKVKLTTDAGKYLVKLGDYIYYVNNDLLTSALFGDGIYKVSATRTSDSSLPGTKVLSTETDGYSSLMTDGTYLYYYKLNDKHFYKYDMTANTETDLMSSFVPPQTTLSGFANVYEYNGELYYTAPTDGGCLYKYNPETKAKSKIVAASVAGAWYNDNYLYYSTYILTNYALWRTNLDTNETVKISSDRIDHLTFDGDTVYCVRVGVSWSNHICKVDKELIQNSSTKIEFTEIFKDDNLYLANFVKSGDCIYYARNPKVYPKRLSKYNITTGKTEVLNSSVKAQAFTIFDNKIYVADSDDKLYVMDIDGTNLTLIAKDVTVNDLIVYGGKLYYSSTHEDNAGLYSYDISAKTIKKICDTNAHGFTICAGKMYFLQTAIEYGLLDTPSNSGNANNDGKLYCFDGAVITKVA